MNPSSAPRARWLRGSSGFARAWRRTFPAGARQCPGPRGPSAGSARRAEVQIQRDFALQPLGRLLQRLEADDAPGQETSETKSILSVVVMCGLSGCKTAIVGGLGAGRSMGGDDLCCPRGCAPPKPRHQPLIARRSPICHANARAGPPPARTSLELTVERPPHEPAAATVRPHHCHAGRLCRWRQRRHQRGRFAALRNRWQPRATCPTCPACTRTCCCAAPAWNQPLPHCKTHPPPARLRNGRVRVRCGWPPDAYRA